MKHLRFVVVAAMLLVPGHVAYAGGLGIPLDSFLTQFVTFVIGLGFVTGVVGLLGWIGAQFDSPFGQILHGSIRFFTLAGILGGGTALLTALGLVAGGVL